MATLGSYTQARLVELIRSLVQTYTHEVVSTGDIQDTLNLKQSSVFMLMPRDMKKFWYGKSAVIGSIAIDSSVTQYLAGARPADLWDPITIKRQWVETAVPYRQDMHRIELEDFEEYIKNRFRDVWGYAIIGEKIYFTSTTAPVSSTYIILYVRTPVGMSASSNLDLPDQFADVLIAMTAAQCVSQMAISTEAKQTALQVFAMMEQEARQAAQLPLQSDVEIKMLNAAAGHSASTVGGSKGSVRPGVD